MQRRSLIGAILGIAFVSSFFISCLNPASQPGRPSSGGWGNVTVTFGSAVTRNLLPDEDQSVAGYDLTFTATGQTTVSRTISSGLTDTFSLPAGEWKLDVKGNNPNSFPLVEGSKSFTVTANETTSVSVSLEPIAGNGILDLSVLMDPVNTALSVSGTLTPAGGGADIALAFTARETGYSVRRIDIPRGYYTLKLALKNGTTELAGGFEVVLVAAGGTTRGEITFAQQDSGSWVMSSVYREPGPGPDPETYEGIRVFTKNYATVHYWNVVPTQPQTTWPGVSLQDHSTGWKYCEFPNATSVSLIFSNNGGGQTANLSRTRGTSGNWWYLNGAWTDYDPETPATPVISSTPEQGRFNVSQNVVLSGSNADDIIYYTKDGSTPTTKSAVYADPIALSAKTTVKAFGVNRDGVSGEVASFCFDIDSSYDLTAPTIASSIPGGSYLDAQTVSFTVTDNAAGTVNAYYTTDGTEPTAASPVYASGTANGSGFTGNSISVTSRTQFKFLVVDASGNETKKTFFFNIGVPQREDFRQETIYFLMTTRFYDGDPANNFRCWDDDTAGNPLSDPAWRGDFKGIIDKLDYIKALGFSAIWITPVVKNMSGYDYHGYHAVNHSVVDPRYESADASYQDLIDAVHAHGMKLVQDIVLNHTGNFGEENLWPLFRKDASDSYINWKDPDALQANDVLEQGAQMLGGAYANLTPGNQFQSRIKALRDGLDVSNYYHHHEFKGGWEQYEVQIGSIAGDCQDLNTENPAVADYLRNAYTRYIDMGVDAFRIDTVKHISRLTFNREFIPAFRQAGGDNFFMFGEVCTRYRSIWNDGKPAISAPFYTWNASTTKADSTYAWSDTATNVDSALAHYNDNISTGNQLSSTNHKLNGNDYHAPDTSKSSGLNVIDFPMHWAFNNISDAWNTATGGDWAYNDATYNVTYVDSHDYAPDGAPENQRYTGSWPDKLSLIFTFRGIPTIYYGTEIEFMKGAAIDVGPNKPLSQTGRAYFGDHIEGSVSVSDFGKYSSATGAMATTLSHPLAQHIRALNLIRRAVPALQRGEYSVDNVNMSGQAFRRRYTNAEEGIDSFALVAVNGDATFTSVPNGTYRDVVTGESHTVSGGSATLSCSGSGNLRVWVLYGGTNQSDPGNVLGGLYPLSWIK